MLKSLGIKALTKEAMEQVVAKNPMKKKEILRYLNLASDASKTEKACREEMAELSGKMENSANDAHIDVTRDGEAWRNRIRTKSRLPRICSDIEPSAAFLRRASLMSTVKTRTIAEPLSPR